MQSNQPAITPAQIAAAVVALIAPTAALLAAFGVYTLTAAQQDAVTKMIFALAGLAAVIVAADSHLRAARNKAAATVKAAQPTKSMGAVITGDASGLTATFKPAQAKQLWYPKAKRVVIGGQEGGTPLAGRPKCVLHTTEGSSIAGAEGAYRASGGSAPHFTISPTAVHQHIPINRSAYSLEHPSGTPETNRAGIVIQVEQVGFASQTADWPDSYYARVAELAQWLHENAGVPMHTHGVDFTDPVRIDAADWADYSGFCGHVHVPNNHHTDPGTGYHIGKVLL